MFKVDIFGTYKHWTFLLGFYSLSSLLRDIGGPFQSGFYRDFFVSVLDLVVRSLPPFDEAWEFRSWTRSFYPVSRRTIPLRLGRHHGSLSDAQLGLFVPDLWTPEVLEGGQKWRRTQTSHTQRKRPQPTPQGRQKEKSMTQCIQDLGAFSNVFTSRFSEDFVIAHSQRTIYWTIIFRNYVFYLLSKIGPFLCPKPR